MTADRPTDSKQDTQTIPFTVTHVIQVILIYTQECSLISSLLSKENNTELKGLVV